MTGNLTRHGNTGIFAVALILLVAFLVIRRRRRRSAPALGASNASYPQYPNARIAMAEIQSNPGYMGGTPIAGTNATGKGEDMMNPFHDRYRVPS